MIFFTSIMSHKMLVGALSEVDSSTVIEHCKSASLSALRTVLEKHAG